MQSQVYLQNAAAVMIPFVFVFGVSAWLMLKSVPVKANFAQQFNIFRSRHTWSMTSLYIMTFGAFSGLSATFPLLIKQIYGELKALPIRWPGRYQVAAGGFRRPCGGRPLSDKFGGARVTHWATLGCWAPRCG